jgi:hypothetical protein
MAEVLSGILRYFPNTMTMTLIVAGIMLAKISWLLVALGGIVVAIAVLVLQGVFQRALNLGPMPGVAVLEACSLLPIATGSYSPAPSMWMALTTYYGVYILMNAVNIYTTTPNKMRKEAIPVQRRKGLGLISILAAVILLMFMLVPRYRTTCETVVGTVTGIALGIGAAVSMWYILDACGADLYPDVHGVMLGLKPDFLRTHPLACTPPE